jgi:hypothetical protein
MNEWERLDERLVSAMQEIQAEFSLDSIELNLFATR